VGEEDTAEAVGTLRQHALRATTRMHKSERLLCESYSRIGGQMSQKLRRAFDFDAAVVTCRNCQYCYPAPADSGGQPWGAFCQEFSFSIPDTEDECAETGNACRQWFPRDISRATAKGENDAERRPRWYEYDD